VDHKDDLKRWQKDKSYLCRKSSRVLPDRSQSLCCQSFIYVRRETLLFSRLSSTGHEVKPINGMFRPHDRIPLVVDLFNRRPALLSIAR